MMVICFQLDKNLLHHRYLKIQKKYFFTIYSILNKNELSPKNINYIHKEARNTQSNIGTYNYQLLNVILLKYDLKYYTKHFFINII